MSSLWEKVNYRSEIHFVLDNIIREYDITKANISVLRDANVLTESDYNYLLNAPKTEREIIIGKMQGRNPEITKTLKSGIANARRIFMQENNIQDSEVLAIRNDSITILGSTPVIKLDITDRVHFRESGCYTSFFHVNAIDLYYFYDRITNTEVLDIKGLGNESVELHKPFILEFLAELFYTAQIDGVRSAINLLSNFYSTYLKKDLPVEYYRELNSMSRYRMNKEFSLYDTMYIDSATEYDKSFIDISHNDLVLRQLNKMLASIYFSTK